MTLSEGSQVLLLNWPVKCVRPVMFSEVLWPLGGSVDSRVWLLYRIVIHNLQKLVSWVDSGCQPPLLSACVCASHIRVVVFTLLLGCSGIIFYHQLLDGSLQRERERKRDVKHLLIYHLLCGIHSNHIMCNEMESGLEHTALFRAVPKCAELLSYLTTWEWDSIMH